MSYREYSERLMIAAEQNRKEKEFWYTQLAGDPIKTFFPYDFNSTNSSNDFDTLDFQLTQDNYNQLLNRLSTITKDSEYTLNLVLITCTILLLNKYTNNNDVLVGMPIYKQEKEGEFINTVVTLRSHVENDLTFKTLLLNVKKVITDSIENQNYPIELLAEKIISNNKDNGFPLFDVAIMLENIHKVEYIDHINCNMSIIFKKLDNNIYGTVKYNHALYKKKSIANIIKHFTNLLQTVLNNVNVLLNTIEIVSEEEKRELLIEFNKTYSEKTITKNIYQLFLDQVEKTPNKPVVIGTQSTGESQILTYQQLYLKTQQLKNLLESNGVKPGKVVALMLERSINIPVGIFGILASGCAYMPIDPEFPQGRIEFMLKDSKAPALVTTGDVFNKIERIKHWENNTIYLEMMEEKTETDMNHDPTLKIRYPAYTIYTSGTTGKPKGVLLDQKSLTNYIEWFTQKIILTGKDKTILTSSFAFDLGYTSLYPSILNGCELHILPREIYLLGDRLLSYIKENSITYLKVTPSLFSLLIKTPDFSKKECPTLRFIAIGGEAINVLDIEKAHQAHPSLQIMNHYGPTEATIGCVTTLIDFNLFSEYKTHPVIGKPINNINIYILGRNLNIMPIGVPGELCIAGDGLANGYLNLPELTHQKFILNPHGLSPHNTNYRVYRTGDLARWLSDGTIEFLGRMDDQVKVMGYRIELKEIQSHLQKHKNIKNALVTVRAVSNSLSENENNDKCLCAYIVPKEDVVQLPQKGELTKSQHLLTLENIIQEEKLKIPSPIQQNGRVGTDHSLSEYFIELQKKNRDKIAIQSKNKFISYNFLGKHSQTVAKHILNEYNDQYKLSKHERTRYARQMLLHGWGIESQEKLKSTTVFVAGAGGGASPTVIQLALAGFGTIIICDYDHVELSNLNRQFLHDETRLNMNKAISAKMTVQQVNPNVNVIARTEKLTKENVAEIVGDAAVILDMFDGLEAKFILSEYALANGIPHVISAMTDINSYSVIFHPPHTPCYHCIFDRKKWETIVAGMSNYVEEYEKNPLPVVATSLFMSTAFAVNEVIKIVLGFENPAYNKFVYFNQRGSKELADTPSFQATTHAFSEHFRNISKEQGFDWEIGWRGNFLEEISISPDPYCPFCGIKSNKSPQIYQTSTPTIQSISRPGTTNETENRETIALLLEPEIPSLIGILGAIHSQKTVVPLDPDFSIDKLSYALEDSEARLILTDDKHFEKAEKLRKKVNKNIKIINICKIQADQTGNSEINEELKRIKKTTQQTAYIIYSPETKPKKGDQLISETNENIIHFSNVIDINLKEKTNPKALLKLINNRNYTLKTTQMDFIISLLIDYTPFEIKETLKKENPENFSIKLREYLQKEVPDYMIPSHFILLDKIPQTPNGKIDFKNLPEPKLNTEDITPPRNDTDKKLIEIWAQILEVEKNQLSINSNFFELGGNSLKATVLISKIHKELDVKLPLSEIFKTPQIKSLSSFIESLEKEKFIAIEPAPIKPFYSLSSGQKRLYILQMMDETSTRYNMFRAFRMKGEIDKNKVERIFFQLIQRHESFRTSFEMNESEPVQIIHEKVPFSLEYYDLTHREGKEKEKDVTEDFLRNFDLTKPPLLRVGLVKVETDDYILILDLHHIISDGTSMRKLEREFRILYAGGSLSPLKLQYRDFSEWQNRLFETDAIKKQKEYWHNRFKGDVPTLKMPNDYPRPSTLTGEGDSVAFEIDKEITQGLKRLISETETTMFMVLMSAFNILLSKYSGQEDIVVGTPIIGRRHVDLENIIGIFVNMLALRNHPKKDKTFFDFLQEVKANAFDANENQDYQFEQLVWDLNLKADSGRYPLFDAVFVIDVDEVKKVDVPAEEDLSKLKISHYLVKMEKLHHEFLLNATERNGIVYMELQYSTQLYKEVTIKKMINHYLEILNQIIENRYYKLQDIKISHQLIAAQPDSIQDEQDDFRF